MKELRSTISANKVPSKSTQYSRLLSTTSKLLAAGCLFGMTIACDNPDVIPGDSVVTYSPGAGEYSWTTIHGGGTLDVTISYDQAVGEIWYTTDGTDPSVNGLTSTLYTGPVELSGAGPIKSICSAPPEGFTCLAVGQANYSFDSQPSTPTVDLSASGGSYETGTLADLTISSTGTGVSAIYYTTDGSTPSSSNGSTYTGAFSISQTAGTSVTVRTACEWTYEAYDACGTDEETFSFTAAPVAPVGSISPSSGVYDYTLKPLSVTIDFPGSTGVFYETDGSTATTGSTPYGSALSISTPTTVSAVCSWSGDDNDCLEVSRTYAFTAATPSMTAGGTFTAAVDVTITSASGDTIYYTTDGSTPTTGSAVYGGTFQVSDAGTTTVKAISANADDTSSVASESYTLNLGNPGNDTLMDAWLEWYSESKCAVNAANGRAPCTDPSGIGGLGTYPYTCPGGGSINWVVASGAPQQRYTISNCTFTTASGLTLTVNGYQSGNFNWSGTGSTTFANNATWDLVDISGDLSGYIDDRRTITSENLTGGSFWSYCTDPDCAASKVYYPYLSTSNNNPVIGAGQVQAGTLP